MLLATGSPGLARAAAAAAAQVELLEILARELAANSEGLRHKGREPLYHLAYEVREHEHACVTAEHGALIHNCASRNRTLTIDLRVGSPELDNTHEIRERFGFDFPESAGLSFPLDDSREAVAALLWLETDKAFKKAQERLAQVRANRQVKADEADSSGDFTTETPAVAVGAGAPAAKDLETWTDRVMEYSRLLAGSKHAYESQAKLVLSRENRFFASSEGARVRDGSVVYRLNLEARTVAPDGMELPLYEAFHARTLAGPPDDAMVRAAVAKLLGTLEALREAPVVKPYVGPAVLVNEAAGVFFHEILGHRLEASDLKSEESGQTFKGKVGQAVTSPLVSVYDDPTRSAVGNVPLLGHYLHDSDGMPAAKTALVESGVLRGFLMSRTPIQGFARSNGHGRREEGYASASRMGNLFVEAAETVPYARLIEMLREECRRQGRPWGLIFEDVSGGFISTGRWIPNAFKVVPLVVYRVSAEDGTRTLVRGVDIIGTPLQAFTKIAAAGDDPGVFNGRCGAGSGQVQVSAVAPSLLFSEIEVQKKEAGSEKPPILPPPAVAPDAELAR